MISENARAAQKAAELERSLADERAMKGWRGRDREGRERRGNSSHFLSFRSSTRSSRREDREDGSRGAHCSGLH